MTALAALLDVHHTKFGFALIEEIPWQLRKCQVPGHGESQRRHNELRLFALAALSLLLVTQNF